MSISLEQLSGTYCVLSTVPLDLRRSLEGWPCTAVALDGRGEAGSACPGSRSCHLCC